MAVFSCLRLGILPRNVSVNSANVAKTVIRNMSDHGPPRFEVRPSAYQWDRFKDMFHFYFMLGVIPLGTTIFLVNIFVGPAKLKEIPEGYVPKDWEYYRHPISRFIAHYVISSYQKHYEKYLHYLFLEDEKRQMRIITEKCKDLMGERNDSEAFFFGPMTAKYEHGVRKGYDDFHDLESVKV